MYKINTLEQTARMIRHWGWQRGIQFWMSRPRLEENGLNPDTWSLVAFIDVRFEDPADEVRWGSALKWLIRRGTSNDLDSSTLGGCSGWPHWISRTWQIPPELLDEYWLRCFDNPKIHRAEPGLKPGPAQKYAWIGSIKSYVGPTGGG